MAGFRLNNRKTANHRYRAMIQPTTVVKAAESKRWWDWRPIKANQAWDFDVEPLARAS